MIDREHITVLKDANRSKLEVIQFMKIKKRVSFQYLLPEDPTVSMLKALIRRNNSVKKAWSEGER